MTDQTGYAPVHRGRLYYQVTGQGYPLILLHAGVADSRMWDDQVPAFSQRYRWRATRKQGNK